MAVQVLDRPALETPSSANSPNAWAEEGCFNRNIWDPGALSADAESLGFRIASQDELPAVHRFSEAIMERRLAPLWALASAHSHTRASAWILPAPSEADHKSGIGGVFLILPLNWDGEAALRAGRFSFETPRIDHLCAPGDEIAAMYFWFCAGEDHDARRSVVRTAIAWIDGACGRLRIYGRAASEAGAQAFQRLRFRLLAPVEQNLFFLDQRP